jgi:hypothetical protein
MKVTSGKSSVPIHVPLDQDEYLANTWIKGSNLLFSTRNYSPANRSFSLNSLPLSSLDDINVKPTIVYTSTDLISTPFSFDAQYSLGSNLLAYPNKGRLYIRTYDGAIDLPMEMDITSLYNASAYDAYWLR